MNAAHLHCPLTPGAWVDPSRYPSDRLHLDAVLIGEQCPQVIQVTGQHRGIRHRPRLSGDESVGGVTAAGSPERLTSVLAGGGRRRCDADGLEYPVHGCVTRVRGVDGDLTGPPSPIWPPLAPVIKRVAHLAQDTTQEPTRLDLSDACALCITSTISARPSWPPAKSARTVPDGTMSTWACSYPVWS
jgi:hypothetical protein